MLRTTTQFTPPTNFSKANNSPAYSAQQQRQGAIILPRTVERLEKHFGDAASFHSKVIVEQHYRPRFDTLLEEITQSGGDRFIFGHDRNTSTHTLLGLLHEDQYPINWLRNIPNTATIQSMDDLLRLLRNINQELPSLTQKYGIEASAQGGLPPLP